MKSFILIVAMFLCGCEPTGHVVESEGHAEGISKSGQVVEATGHAVGRAKEGR